MTNKMIASFLVKAHEEWRVSPEQVCSAITKVGFPCTSVGVRESPNAGPSDATKDSFMQLWQPNEAYLAEIKTQGSDLETNLQGRDKLRDGLAGYSIELSKLSTDCNSETGGITFGDRKQLLRG